MKSTCPKCGKVHDQESIDIDSITRRHGIENQIHCELDIYKWDSVCDSCQKGYVWKSNTDKMAAKLELSSMDLIKMQLESQYNKLYDYCKRTSYLKE